MKNRYKNQRFSILGDSLSTYEGYLPAGYPTFYTARGGAVTGIYGWRDTWWGQVITHFDARLLVNNSWSGSYVCKPVDCEIPSYGCSDERCGGLGVGDVMPDCILVCLGTNDRGAGFPLTGDDKSDLRVIENAYGVMLDKIKRNYPAAEIWCLSFPVTTCSRDPVFEFPLTHRGIPTAAYGARILEIAAEKGCRTVELWDEEALCDTVDCLHPNYAGMHMIAERVIAAMEKADGDEEG